MVETLFKKQGDLLGLSTEVESLTGSTVTLDDGTERDCEDGTTFLAVDTGAVYILYKEKWYKL